jgi:hypothetical protein
MGYVNRKECIGFYVPYIYILVVSIWFYDTASWNLSFRLFRKHRCNIYIMLFSRVNLSFKNELLTARYIGFISHQKRVTWK